MSKKKEVLILVLIIGVAAFLRLFQLGKIPFELFGDEVDMGYQAYSILQTGKSYTGQFLPLYFHSFSEFRTPVFIYTLIPFIKIFGLNEIGVRFSAAFFGILDVLLTYLLIRKLKDKKLAVIAALVIAIVPWHIQFSRIGYEATLLQALFLSGTIFFLAGLKNKKFLVVSVILFALTPYTYSTANIFSPLLVASLVFIFRKELFSVNLRWLIFPLLIAFIILLPLGRDIIGGQATGRFSAISILSDQKIVDSVTTKRIDGNFERLFHNKPLAFGDVFIANYLTTFSPQFLFLSGDPNPRHSVGEMGELYLVFLPFLLVGIFYAIRQKGKGNLLFLFWLVLSPIPSALTQEGGSHAVRLFLMLPPLVYFTSFGIYQVLELRNKLLRNFLFTAFLLVLITNIAFYLHQYYVHYPQEAWRYWQYGYKEPAQYVAQNQQNYKEILINNKKDPSLSKFLFWAKVDPNYVQKMFKTDMPQSQVLPGFDGFKLGKFYFGYPSNGVQSLLNSNRIYLAFQGGEIPGDWDWRKNPPLSVKVLKVITEPFSNIPYIYLVTGKSS